MTKGSHPVPVLLCACLVTLNCSATVKVTLTLARLLGTVHNLDHGPKILCIVWKILLSLTKKADVTRPLQILANVLPISPATTGTDVNFKERCTPELGHQDFRRHKPILGLVISKGPRTFNRLNQCDCQ